MYEKTQSAFPPGTARAAVELHGDDWRGGFHVTELRDAAKMKSCEQLAAADVTPTERASWENFREQNRRSLRAAVKV